MKKKFLGVITAMLTLGVLGGTAFIAADDNVEQIEIVEAASTDKWYFIGSPTGWSHNDSYLFTYNSTSKVHEFTIDLKVGDTFKITLGKSWNTQAHYRNQSNCGTNDSDFGTYFGGDGDNFKTLKENTYKFSLLDAASTYGDVEWGLSVEVVTVQKHTITFYDKDNAAVLETKEYSDGAVCNSLPFKEYDGYRLEGWYKETSYTNKFEKNSTVSSDLKLYPKYIPAVDFRILISEHWFGASSSDDHSMSVYLWRDTLEGGHNTWPGEAIDLNTKFDNYYVFTIDASKSYSKLIINNDKLQNYPKQTINLSLDNYDDLLVYNIGDLNTDENKYNATCAGVNEISFAYKVKELAGDFVDNGDESEITIECANKYQTAKEMFLSLSAEAKENFQNFNDGDLLLAKTTYEHWCHVNGDANPYSGDVVSGAKLAFDVNNNSMYLIVIIALVSVSFIGFIILKKKRQTN